VHDGVLGGAGACKDAFEPAVAATSLLGARRVVAVQTAHADGQLGVGGALLAVGGGSVGRLTA
jgi:hypothetical protein